MMENFIYLTGAIYIGVTVSRLTFWIEDVIEGKH